MQMTSTMLKPFYSTPHPLAGEMVPLTLFDLAAFDVFVPIMLVYPAPTPSNEALKEGLRRAVAPYPRLAGRLAVDHRGRRCIHINNEGVLVVEASVAADLSTNGTNSADLYPELPLAEEHNGVPLLHIKLNRYKCGGLAIGLACHHYYTGDGHSVSTFLTTWASAVRQGRNFTDPSPFLSRGMPGNLPTPEIQGQEDPPAAALSLSKFNSIKVHFTAEFVAELKARVGGARCSTFQCLLAHLWKRTTAARGLKPEEFTQVRVAVDCRSRADPAMPMDFFGNMVLGAFPRLQARDVLGWTYGRVVGSIRDAVARVDGEYVRSFLDLGAAHEEELMAKGGTMRCPNLEADSWLGFRFHDLDFSGGPPTAFRMPDLPVEGMMVFMPSCEAAKGGFDVYMAVAEDHVAAFQQICHSLD